MNPKRCVGYFGGGKRALNLEGKVIGTSNLTPDKITEIGPWSEAKIVKALKSGVIDRAIALPYLFNRP